ncbi:MAG: hypothetical protein M1324_01240 [Patescibacteria group bacterium]|nr:hypothetical protein [Patescibacteria group bacterium]
MNANGIDLVIAAMKFIPEPQAKVDCLLNTLSDKRLSLTAEEIREFLTSVSKEYFHSDLSLLCTLIRERITLTTWSSSAFSNLMKAMSIYSRRSGKTAADEAVINELADVG